MIIQKIIKVIQSCESLDQHWSCVGWIHRLAISETISSGAYMYLSVNYLDDNYLRLYK